MNLNLRPASECKFDAVSLGEVMLRLDPGEGRIRTARSFRAWEGGGEYNVIRGLRKCFKMNTAVITAFADNEVGMLMEDFICQGGVDTSLIKWMKTDGIGRICRNGLNFTERGFGIRGAVGCSDSANTAISKATPDDFDFEYIFGTLGVRWQIRPIPSVFIHLIREVSTPPWQMKSSISIPTSLSANAVITAVFILKQLQRLRKSADKCNARVEKSQADHACMRKKERYGLEKK